MLLDSYTLKSGLSSLLPAPVPASFAKRVNSSFAKIEALLKTVQVHPSPPEALVQAYLIHIADKNNANFRKILDLKGIRSRQDQNHLVELFQVHRASDRHAPNLQESNPILAAAGQGTSSASSSSSIGLGSSSIVGGSISSSRFDPSMLGSAIISAAKDGVDRFGNPAAGGSGGGGPGGPGTTSTPSGVLSPGSTGGGGTPGNAPGQQASGSGDGGGTSSYTAGNLNDNLNLKSIGKFFRRDLGGFGGRFGRGGEEGSWS